MKQFLGLALVIAALAGSASNARPLKRTTVKGAEPFAQCFAAAQDRVARPWSYIPKANGGGTFSNLGATGVSHPYFLEVAERGARLEIRLASGADRSVMRAVDRCI